MIYWQPGGITFPPTLLPPSRGIACIVSCGVERTSEAETKRERRSRKRKSSIYFREKKKKRSSPSLEKIEKSFFFLPFPMYTYSVYDIYVCKCEKWKRKEIEEEKVERQVSLSFQRSS